MKVKKNIYKDCPEEWSSILIDGFSRSTAYPAGHRGDHGNDGWLPQPTLLQTLRVGGRN